MSDIVVVVYIVLLMLMVFSVMGMVYVLIVVLMCDSDVFMLIVKVWMLVGKILFGQISCSICVLLMSMVYRLNSMRIIYFELFEYVFSVSSVRLDQRKL